MQEVKWLVRLGIQVPESAHTILLQEERFKKYSDHLHLCLRELSSVITNIPPCFRHMYTSHIDAVEQNLQPGLSTLAWNSMNIGTGWFFLMKISSHLLMFCHWIFDPNFFTLTDLG